MKKNSFSLKSRLASFRHVLSGLRRFSTSEINGRIQIIVAIFLVFLGFVFEIKTFEWTALCLSIAVVLAMEIVNSSIERIFDLYSKQHSHKLKEIKDLSASAVLLTSFAALINGILIIAPKAYDFVGDLTFSDIPWG